MFSIELVQASERLSFAGKPRRLTVSISSSPSRMLAATPGACWALPDGPRAVSRAIAVAVAQSRPDCLAGGGGIRTLAFQNRMHQIPRTCASRIASARAATLKKEFQTLERRPSSRLHGEVQQFRFRDAEVRIPPPQPASQSRASRSVRGGRGARRGNAGPIAASTRNRTRCDVRQGAHTTCRNQAFRDGHGCGRAPTPSSDMGGTTMDDHLPAARFLAIITTKSAVASH